MKTRGKQKQQQEKDRGLSYFSSLFMSFLDNERFLLAMAFHAFEHDSLRYSYDPFGFPPLKPASPDNRYVSDRPQS